MNGDVQVEYSSSKPLLKVLVRNYHVVNSVKVGRLPFLIPIISPTQNIRLLLMVEDKSIVSMGQQTLVDVLFEHKLTDVVLYVSKPEEVLKYDRYRMLSSGNT